MKEFRVKNHMIDSVLTIGPDTTLPEASQIMKAKGVRRLPVVKNGKLVGIVSLTDIQEASPSDATSLSIWEMNYLLSQLKISNIMTKDPISVTEETPMGDVARLMLENKIGGIPVVNADGGVAGIITESDIFRLIVSEWSEN